MKIDRGNFCMLIIRLPILVGFGSIMTRTDCWQYFLIRSLIRISFWWSLGPVWYQPTIRSLALTFLNMWYMHSKYSWSRNHTSRSLSSSSKGTAKLFAISSTPLKIIRTICSKYERFMLTTAPSPLSQLLNSGIEDCKIFWRRRISILRKTGKKK